MKIACFGSKGYDVQYFHKVNEAFGFDITYIDEHLTAQSASRANGYDVVCIFVNDCCDAAVIEAIARVGVKLIALRCAGFNNVDRTAAERAGLKIVRVPAYSPFAVAEHALALLMTLNRKTHLAALRSRMGNFSLDGLMGIDLNGKVAGFIGTGKIAKIFMTALHGIGMKLVAYDLYPDNAFAAKYDVTYTTMDEVLKEAHVVTLHCPLNKDTAHLINKGTISKMKRGVLLINTGRGGLIDTQALIEGLKSGHIGGAGLDVYENEQEYFFENRSAEVIQDDILARLMTFNNVVLTPHQAFFTEEAVSAIAHVTLQNVRAFKDNAKLDNEVTVDTL